MGSRIAAFLAMLERGQDSALLRFSLGNEYLTQDDPASAADHLRQAVDLDPNYSAAWKLLGRALVDDDRDAEARDTYRSGIEIAERNGDHQAAKEMRVFLKRIDKKKPTG